MQINCPKCGFSREIPENKIPERTEMATCPKCGEKFRFRSLDSEEFLLSESEDQQQASNAETKRPELFYGPDAHLHDRPTPGPAPAREADAGIPDVPPPFEDLDNYGFFPGIVETIKRAMLSPRLFFEVMPLKGLARPLIFALLLFEFYLIFSLFWSFTGLPALSSLAPNMTMLDSDVAAGAEPVYLFGILPLMFVLNLFLSAGVLHAVLMLLRAAPRGFEATFRATAYSYAPLVLSVLPYGYLAGWLWSLPISIIGCAALHRTQPWRVVLAVALVAGVVGMLYFATMQIPHPGAAQ
ncbi:MAG: zinc-ribbon domain-containing protein [Desulfovibrio sp.]